jgi:hypothetical protein
MIKVSYDAEHNAVVIVFEGEIDAAQVENAFIDIEMIMPRCSKGFKVLADFSPVSATEPEVQGELEKAMDLFNAQGVTEILRVLPDPDLDIGFDIMSRSHYSRQVQIHTLRSMDEARAFLQNPSRKA